MTLLPVCVLAGGIGSRLGDLVKATPKPLLEVAGRPFLEWQLELLKAHGAHRVVLCVGYLGEQIEARLGTGADFGLELVYSYDPPEPAGTAGAIRAAMPLLGDRFLVLYGDTYLRLDYAEAQRTWIESRLPAFMTVLRNEGRWDTSNAVFADGRVTRYEKTEPGPGMDWIDYGLGGLTVDALSLAPDEHDLARVYQLAATQGALCGYEASERFYEIGSPASLAETSAFLRSSARRA
jgi:MurNAc alpha-1-phosphate uridylyltransferase